MTVTDVTCNEEPIQKGAATIVKRPYCNGSYIFYSLWEVHKPWPPKPGMCGDPIDGGIAMWSGLEVIECGTSSTMGPTYYNGGYPWDVC